jgi:hypothetical protein
MGMRVCRISGSGFAILLVLMFLLLLYTLGVAFLVVTIIQWEIVEAWYDDVRAREIAETGIYSAINRLYLTFPMQVSRPEVPCIWRYWGDDIDEDELDGNEEENLVPIEYAQNPSFAWEVDEDPYENDNLQPRLINVTFPWGVTKEIGFSGFSPKRTGRYGINSEIFSLKVVDTSSQLYINEGLGHPYNSAVMRRMLNVLGVYLRENLGWGEVPQNLGDIIIGNRPPSGYRYKQELLKFLPHEAYLKVKHFICAHTWVDTKVCNPVPLSMAAADAYDPELFEVRPKDSMGDPITRYGRGKDFMGNLITYPLMFYDPGLDNRQNARIYGFDELNPCWIEITSRAPVNINTASKAVLVAVLSYLEGFFALEQLRVFGAELVDFYEGECELATLYRTIPVGGPYADAGYPVRAEEIAEKILQRRSNKPFSSWEDFERFVDGLTGSSIRDDRSTAYYVSPHWSWDYKSIDSSLQKLYTPQAIADVIKANANPNLHLNEINPDATIWRWVDKTDLIKNSTEFCFIPTGVFEIESQGLVLKPKEGYNSLESPNIVRGRRKIITEVKLYDICKETTQQDFYRGRPSPSGLSTSNMCTTQLGPEPDQGLAPYENGFEGYILLSTFWGDEERLSLKRDQKGTVFETTSSEGCLAGFGSQMHAHYDFDFRLHHSRSGIINPLTEQQQTGIIKSSEWDRRHDRTENSSNYTSPYCLRYNPSRYRIARSYRFGLSSGAYIAPNDHRIDGVYCERWAVLPYYSAGDPLRDADGNPNRQNAGVNVYNGSISYWLKPNFFPEFNSQSRVFADISTQRGYFTNYFTRGDGIFSVIPRSTEDYEYPNYRGLPSVERRPITLSFMLTGWEFYTCTAKYYPGGETTWKEYYTFFCETPTLNHAGCMIDGWSPDWHSTTSTPYSLFEAHKWIHITCMWGMDEPDVEGIYWDRDGTSRSGSMQTEKGDENIYCKIFINGRLLDGPHFTFLCWNRTGSASRPFDIFYPDWFDWRVNSLRIGGPSIWSPVTKFYKSKADATIDEFYLWERHMEDTEGPEPVIIQALWGRGRYYNDVDFPAEFESNDVNLQKLFEGVRSLPEGSSSTIAPHLDERPLILGITWSVYKEGFLDYRGTPSQPDIPQPIAPQIGVLLSFDGGSNWIPAGGLWMKKNWWTWVFRRLEGKPYRVRYKVIFSHDSPNGSNAILLQTPVFDEILIYYKAGPARFLSWVLV